MGPLSGSLDQRLLLGPTCSDLPDVVARDEMSLLIDHPPGGLLG
jgi:hypothetical protein